MLVTATALVERNEQLATLADLVAGSGHCALIEGEAGAGKTALLSEALHDVPNGVAVWRGQCEPLAVPAPFSALFEMMSILPPEIADSIRSGEDIIVVYAAILAVMRRRPVVLVLDDLQWADAATAGLARYIGRRLGETPSTMLCAYRHDELDSDREVAEVLSELGFVSARIDVPPLSPAGVRELAEQIAPLRAGEAEDIHTATGGNALFVVEALRSTGDELPASVGDLVVAQVRRLTVAVQNLVESIALCPDGLALDVALTLSPDAGEHIDSACERRVLAVVEDRVTCRHEVLRAAIDASIPPVRRRELHRRLLRTLEPTAAHGRDAAHLAYHACESGFPGPAVQYSLAAAAAAVAAGGHREAAGHLARALRFDETMEADVLDRTLSDAFTELFMIGQFDAAATVLDRRTALWSTGDEPLGVLVQRVELAAMCGETGTDIPLAEMIMERDPEPGSRARLVAARSLSAIAWTDGRYEEAIALLQRELGTGPPDDDVFAIRVRAALATLHHAVGDEAGTPMLTAALAEALECGADDHAAFAFNNLLARSAWTYDVPGARAWYSAGHEFTTARQLDRWTRSMQGSAAVTELLAGEWRAARAEISGAVGPGYPANPDTLDSEAMYVDAVVRIREGTPARDAVHRAIATYAPEKMPNCELVTLVELAMEAAWCGLCPLDDARARRDALLAGHRMGFDPWARAHIGFWSLRCFAEPGIDDAPGAVGMELAGDLDTAAAEWDRLGMPFYAVLVRADLTDPPVGEVLDTLDALGAAGTINAVRRRWTERGVIVPARDAHPSGLTTRQLEVLELIGSGCTNAQIGDRLFISEKTAGHHVSAILRRLEVSTRLAAASLARDRHWI